MLMLAHLNASTVWAVNKKELAIANSFHILSSNFHYSFNA